MKVPNKILNAVMKLVDNQAISPEERAAVKQWASEGITKRTAPIAVAASTPKE